MSRFGEPWFAGLPDGWTVQRFKRMATIRNGQVDPRKPEYRDLPLYAPNHIESGTGVLLNIESAAEQGADSGKYPVRAGEIIYSKIRPALRKVIVAPADGLCSADMYAVLPVAGVHARFLFWAMLSEGFCAAAELASDRVAMPKVNRDTLTDFPIPSPPVAGQRRVASFLDSKTAAIDTLIEKKRRLLKLLAEKRSALINQAVTKGLEPGVPLKDTGIPWIGAGPSHWNVVRLKFMVTHVVDCHHSTPIYEEDGQYPALRTADVSPGYLDVANARRVSATEYRARIERLRPAVNDVVYSREGERYGMAALVPKGVEVCLAQRVMLFRLSEHQDAGYFMWALNSDSVYQQMKQYVVGATSPHVNIGDIREAWLPAPSRVEQEGIGVFITAELSKQRKLEIQIERHIALLQEYRQALITAAVTGQLDVTAEATDAATAEAMEHAGSTNTKKPRPDEEAA